MVATISCNASGCSNAWYSNNKQNINAVAIRTGTVRRVWFAIRTAMGIFIAIVGEILVFFDFYNLTLVKQQ